MKKCSKCDLENLDHLTVCVECGTTLESGRTESTAENYIPPRSGKFKVFKLFFYRLQRSLGSLDSGGRNSNPTIAGRDFISDVSEKSKGFISEFLEVLSQSKPVFFSLIPGLGHIFQKRWKRGSTIAGIYFLFLLLGLFFYGRMFSNICFGVMLTAQAIAFYDCIPISLSFFKTLPSRLITMGIIFFFVLASYRAIYLAVNERVTGAWVPFNAEPAFSSGDFVLIQNKHKYQRGDIVFFYSNAAGRTYRGRGYAYYRLGNGTYFDRIIGLPGDLVEIIENLVFINSKLLPDQFYPLQKNQLKSMKRQLKENEYFVYDSTNNFLGNIPTGLLLLHNVVLEDNIRGKAFMVYAPLHRMKFIE